MRNVQSTLLYRWFEEVWNKDNENAIEKLMTRDAEAHGVFREDQPKGAEGFKLFFKSFRAQFHDVKMEVDDVISQDDLESARTTVTAIHTASMKPISFSGICMVKIEDGKIAEAWNNYDFPNLFQQ